jgi:hypothetical protein
MGLDKQIIPISFGTGQDTKTDPKQVELGTLIELQNGIFPSLKRLEKRDGYGPFMRNIEGTSQSISKAVAGMTFKNELCLFTGERLYSYSKASDRWSDKGQAVSCSVSVTPVNRNTYGQTAADSCLHPSGVFAYAWEDTRGGIRYSIIDQRTGHSIVSDELLTSIGTKPRCVALGVYVLLFYLDEAANRIIYHAISINSPSVLGPLVEFALNLSNNNAYDVCVNSERVFVTWDTTEVGNAVAIRYINSFLTVSAVVLLGAQVAERITVTSDATNQNVWIAYRNGSTVRAACFDYSLNSVRAFTTLETGVVDVENITASAQNQTVTVFYELPAALKSNHFVRVTTCPQVGAIGTPATMLRSVGLGSKSFIYEGAIYLAVVHDSALQPTYFIVNATGFIVAKIASNLAGGLVTSRSLPQVYGTGTATRFGFAYLIRDTLTTINGAVFTQTGVQAATVNFNTSNTYLRAEIASNQHIAGGIVNMYDGANLVEHGFNLFPEGLTVTPATTGGGLNAGTRLYYAVYTWTDNQGQIHRSAPSIPIQAVNTVGTTLNITCDLTAGSPTATGIASTAGVFIGMIFSDGTTSGRVIAFTSSTITIDQNFLTTAPGVVIASTTTSSNTLSLPTLRLTAKNNARSPVTIVVYRTQDLGQTPYQVSSISSPIFNDPSVDTVSFVDTTSDSVIIGNPILYTFGGEIENISLPATSVLIPYKNRMIALPSESDTSFWYSKESPPGVPIEFNDGFVQNVVQQGGGLTGGAELDDKLILFKRQNILATAFAGPLNTGAQNDVAQPELIPTDSGCDNPRSIVLTPVGLMFQSLKGIYLLDRSLSVSYVGAAVEKYNDQKITSAILVSNTNLVIFTLENGLALTYDYLIKQWGEFSNIAAVDAVLFERKHTFFTRFGVANQETPGLNTDNGALVPLKLTTAWISLAGLQGFQRIYHVLLLGEYKSPHTLRVQVAYDFNPTVVQDELIDATAVCATPNYGDDAEYGDTTPYGGEFPLYQWRINFIRQKCQSIRLTIQDVQSTNIGEGFNISGMTLTAGLKKGTNKLPATRVT